VTNNRQGINTREKKEKRKEKKKRKKEKKKRSLFGFKRYRKEYGSKKSLIKRQTTITRNAI